MEWEFARSPMARGFGWCWRRNVAGTCVFVNPAAAARVMTVLVGHATILDSSELERRILQLEGKKKEEGLSPENQRLLEAGPRYPEY